MKLSVFVEREGPGALSRICRTTGLAYTTVFALAHGRSNARRDTAAKVSAATGGAVTVVELLQNTRVRGPMVEP